MRETLRLSDVPEFHRILRDLALRQNPGLSEEEIVLSNIPFTLCYRDGQTFLCNLSPENFRVQELDKPERAVSPINNSSQERRIVYSIRSEDGIWHTPIGTTCILKDILGLEHRYTNAMETVLLDGAHDVVQRDLLYQYGDDLCGYGEANGLQGALITQAYFDSLGDEDPIREHLRLLLHARVPLTRNGLKLLKAHSRQRTPEQIKAARVRVESSAVPVPVVLSPTEPQQLTPTRYKQVPPADAGRRFLDQKVVESLRPHAALFLGALPQNLHNDASIMFASGEANVPCTQELLSKLRELTGDLLTVGEIQQRCEHGLSFDDLTPQILSYWSELEDQLFDLTNLQKIRWQYHLVKGQLLVNEKSQLREAWGKVKANHLELSYIPLPIIPEDILLGDREQRIWYSRKNALSLHLRDSPALLERLNQMRLNSADLSALTAAKQAVAASKLPLGQLQALRLQTRFIQSVPEELRADFRSAMQDNNFPRYLRTVLAETAERLNLDSNTLAPPRLAPHIRKALRLGWSHFAVELGSDKMSLFHALNVDRYSLKQAARLKALVSAQLLETAISVEDRLYLMDNFYLCRGMHPPSERQWIQDSLEKREYTPRLLAVLSDLIPLLKRLKREEQERQAKQAAAAAQRAAQQEAEMKARAARATRQAPKTVQHQLPQQELHERLVSRWRALRPLHVKALRAITQTMLEEDLPDVCQEFQSNGGSITVNMDKMIQKYLEERDISSVLKL